MWVNKFKIKKIFNKKYANTSSVYESIYNDLGMAISPKVLTGVNGIGGGNFGSYINVNSRVTNNTILDISSDSRDEDMSTDFNYSFDRSVSGQTFYRNTIINNCYSVIVNLTYFLPVGVYSDNSEGVYVVVKANGGIIYNSNGKTNRPESGGYVDEDIETSTSSYLVDKYSMHFCVFSRFMKEFYFENPCTVEIIYYFNFLHYNERLATPMSGTCNIVSMKKSNRNITRDIYATVIEQVDPTTN